MKLARFLRIAPRIVVVAASIAVASGALAQRVNGAIQSQTAVQVQSLKSDFNGDGRSDILFDNDAAPSS
jgi:hypothetical protein